MSLTALMELGNKSLLCFLTLISLDILASHWFKDAMEDWIVQIEQDLNNELFQFVSRQRRNGISWEHTSFKEDSLPGWKELISDIQFRLEGGLGLLLLRGLSLEGVELEWARHMLWKLFAFILRVASQWPAVWIYPGGIRSHQAPGTFHRRLDRYSIYAYIYI